MIKKLIKAVSKQNKKVDRICADFDKLNERAMQSFLLTKESK